jgi:hypothetical protein
MSSNESSESFTKLPDRPPPHDVVKGLQPDKEFVVASCVRVSPSEELSPHGRLSGGQSRGTGHQRTPSGINELTIINDFRI